jgi:hypothetical protein
LRPEIEPGSATWKAIELYVDERITNLRLSNDSEGLNEIATALIRGQIKALKALLALTKAPAIDADEGSQPY